MEIKNRSMIYKPEDLNMVDMATGGGVSDNYVQMASGIIFHKGLEDDQLTIHIIEPQFSGARAKASLGDVAVSIFISRS
jgi:hypothetical protein